jgi:hypothetical protein
MESIYHTPYSLFKIYDYSLAILMQDRLSTTAGDAMNELVRCCSEACCTFQASQEHNSAVYWTWAAVSQASTDDAVSALTRSQLMYQFRLGILILYCYFVTSSAPRAADFPFQEAVGGIEACRKTLFRFAMRWAKSLSFLNAFEILAQTILDGPALGFTIDTSTSTFMDYASSDLSPRDRLTKLEGYLLEMKLNKVHAAVVSLIEEMMSGMQPQEPEATQLQFAPALYNGGLDLFTF